MINVQLSQNKNVLIHDIYSNLYIERIIYTLLCYIILFFSLKNYTILL